MKPDVVTKQYLGRNEVFADVFNYLLYGGRQEIETGQLFEMDTTELAVPYGTEDAGASVQKERDVLKCLVAKGDGHRAFLILGIEEQTEIHYAMPVKNMIYDALQYGKQVEQTKKSWEGHRLKGITSGEYLSGFRKEDCLLPVITLVVYMGVEAWQGPLSLHEMFDAEDEEILKFVQDYKIHLIAPADITGENMDKFKTDFGLVMRYIGKSKQANELEALLEENVGFRHMSCSAVHVINAVTRSDIQMEEQEAEVDMCQAIEDMKRHSRERGHEEGRSEGINIGRSEGMREQARSVANALFQTGMEIDQISRIVRFDEAVVREWLEPAM